MLNKNLKMSVFDLLIIVVLTHVIAYTTRRVDIIEFIKAIMCVKNSNPPVDRITQ